MKNVLFSYWCKLEDIAAVAFSKEHPNVAIGFTMYGNGKWHKIEHGGGNFAQEAEHFGESYLIYHTFILEGASNILLKQFIEASKSCKVVVAHKLTTGFFLIQGIEGDNNAKGGFTGSNTRIEVSPELNEVKFSGTSKRFAPICKLEEKNFETL